MRFGPKYKTARCVIKCGDHFCLAVHSSFWAKRERRWGLPGGRVEWGEAPRRAAQRELEEELSLHIPDLIAVGHFPYKGADHMIYTAEIEQRVFEYDTSELLDLGWFSATEILEMADTAKLHAGYEHLAVQQALDSIADSTS